VCGRYYRSSDKQAIAESFQAQTTGDDLACVPGYNIAPTTTQPVIRQHRDSLVREIVSMRWGMVGYRSNGPDPKRSTFNARSESLEKNGLWRAPFYRRRCLVPADGWYEWFKPTKEPWRFALKEGGPFAFAGIWDAWENRADQQWLQSFAIVTVPANAVAASVHDRMPAILHPADYDRWLDREEIERPPTDLLHSTESTAMLRFHADPKVGDVRNQGPELLNSV
jgi:putative SOS response-associated peptidase YedK